MFIETMITLLISLFSNAANPGIVDSPVQKQNEFIKTICRHELPFASILSPYGIVNNSVLIIVCFVLIPLLIILIFGNQIFDIGTHLQDTGNRTIRVG